MVRVTILCIALLFLLFIHSVSAAVSSEGYYCNGADFSKDGFVNGTDLSVFASHFGRADCEIPCEFMVANWSETGGLLANNAFDRLFSPSAANYMSVIPVAGGYALKSEGIYGIHAYNRTVVKEFSEPKQGWGGRLFVNLHDLNHHYNPTDLAFIGGYTGLSTTTRNFVIGAMFYPFDFYEAPEWSGIGAYIYLKAFHNSNRGLSGVLHQDTRAKMFLVEDANTDNFPTPWPDRFIEIEWFLTPSHNLFARVDGSEWKQAIEGHANYADFQRLDAGWVSSLSGGNVLLKDVELYNETCIPGWMLE